MSAGTGSVDEPPDHWGDGVAGRASADFAEAYRGLFLPAMRLAYRVTGDRSLAEDVAAEALARAYSRWSSVSRMDSPQAWVLRVATNLALDCVRRQRVVAEKLPALGVPVLGADHADQVAARLALVAALGALPRRQRESIALYYLGGLTEDEVSRSLDITPSSVRTHLQRGLATLRRQLGAAGEVPRVAV